MLISEIQWYVDLCVVEIIQKGYVQSKIRCKIRHSRKNKFGAMTIFIYYIFMNVQVLYSPSPFLPPTLLLPLSVSKFISLPPVSATAHLPRCIEGNRCPKSDIKPETYSLSRTVRMSKELTQTKGKPQTINITAGTCLRVIKGENNVLSCEIVRLTEGDGCSPGSCVTLMAAVVEAKISRCRPGIQTLCPRLICALASVATSLNFHENKHATIPQKY